MRSDKRQNGDQRPLVTPPSSRKSIGSFLLTPKPLSFDGSFSLKRQKDHEPVISPEPEEKTPAYIVGEYDSTTTPADQSAGDAHEGLLEEKSGKRPPKRPRDIDEETFLIHQSPPSQRPKTEQDTEVVATTKASRASHKRKAPPSEENQSGTFTLAKKAKLENNTAQGPDDQGSSEVEKPDSWRQNIKPLSPQHMSILKSQGYDGKLDDDIINMAQELLHQQFPDFDGLQPVAALLFPGYSVLTKAVQIHYDAGRMHWLTTCYKDGSILVADSIKTNYLSLSIREQIQNIYSHVVHQPLRHLKFLNVDQQRNGYDCGVFAVAFAYELLAEDGDPEAIYDHQSIREHLTACLQNGKITKFPIQKKISDSTSFNAKGGRKTK